MTQTLTKDFAHHYYMCDMTVEGMRYERTLFITNAAVNFLRHHGFVLFAV